MFKTTEQNKFKSKNKTFTSKNVIFTLLVLLFKLKAIPLHVCHNWRKCGTIKRIESCSLFQLQRDIKLNQFAKNWIDYFRQFFMFFISVCFAFFDHVSWVLLIVDPSTPAQTPFLSVSFHIGSVFGTQCSCIPELRKCSVQCHIRFIFRFCNKLSFIAKSELYIIDWWV